jgi:hypothetical protein
VPFFFRKKDLVQVLREQKQSDYRKAKSHQDFDLETWFSFFISQNGSKVFHPDQNIIIRLSAGNWAWLQIAPGPEGKRYGDEVPYAFLDAFCVSVSLMCDFIGIIPLGKVKAPTIWYIRDEPKLRKFVQGETRLTGIQKAAVKQYFESTDIDPTYKIYWERRKRKVRNVTG